MKPAPGTHAQTQDAHAGGATSRAPLSCERITTAALDYVDTNCLGDLSMRRLGAELGVEAMSLYRYFPSKACLMEAIVRRALGDLMLPSADADSSWESQVRAYAHSFRAVARQHPHLIPLLATLGPINPTLAAIHDRLVDLWHQAGLDVTTATKAQCALQGYLTGSSLWDAPTTGSGDGSESGVRPPRLTGRAECPNGEADFDFGLDALMRGLAQRVAEARTAP